MIQDPPARLPLRAALGAGIALAALALGWAQFRGLDLMDAATHFLTYQFPEDNPDTHTRYHIVARPLWLLCGGNVVAFRLLTLALLSTAAVLFWRSWRRILSDPADDSVTCGLLLLSTLAGLAWLPVLLGYNSLSTFFALLALTTLAPALAVAGSPPVSLARRLGWAAAFLVLTALTAVVKPPAALALLAWGGFLALAVLPVPRFWRLLPPVLAAGGALAILLQTRHWAEQSLRDFPDAMNFAGLELRPHWILETLARYGTELAAFLPALGRDLAWLVLPALGLATFAAARGRRPELAGRGGAIAVAVFFGALVVVAAARGLWDGSYANAVSGEMAQLYLVLWAAMLPAWLVGWIGHPQQQTRPSLIAVAFFFLPLTCGLGSTNTLYFSALHWTVFWTAGLLIVSRSVAGALAEPRFHRWFTLLLLLAAGSHLWSGHFLQPYMHQPPLWRQDVPIAVGFPATTLKLDEPTARFLTEVRNTLDRHGYRPGDDVFGFFNLPGLVYAIGARPPGAPWYFGTWYHGDDTDGGKIRAVPLERRQRAWIITQADVTSFRREFMNCGIDFPNGYEMIGQTTNPTTGLAIGIWKPKSRR